jgi:uncharacterized RDD family membrane protein YckC
MQDENPYQSPMADCSPRPAAAPASSPLASEAARFANLVLDCAGIHLIVYLAQMAMIFAHCYPRREGDAVPVPFADFPMPLITLIVTPIPYSAVPLPLALLVAPVYFLVSEGLWARTPAKFVTRTKVITVDGGPPTPAHILLRSVFRLIPFEAISFLESHPAGWHDRFSNTRVVPDR